MYRYPDISSSAHRGGPRSYWTYFLDFIHSNVYLCNFFCQVSKVNISGILAFGNEVERVGSVVELAD